MALTDLQLKTGSEYAVIGLQKHLAPLTYFAHSFSELDATKGASVAVPVYSLSAAADFNSSTNNWGNAQDIDGVTVSLDQHIKSSIKLDDVYANESNTYFLRDGAKAIADVIAHKANAYVFSLL